MNPYQQQVIDRIGTLGARTLQEQVLPAVRDKFIAGGTYGGSRNAEIFGNKVRDAMEGISAAQSQALQTGYTDAQTAAQADLTRQAGLAQTAGTLGQAGTSAGLAQGTNLAALAAQAQSLGLTGVGALQSMGATQQALNQKNLDTAYADFMAQRGYPQAQNTAMQGAIAGVAQAVPKATQQAGTVPTGTFNPSGLQTVGSTFADISGILKNAGADANTIQSIWNAISGGNTGTAAAADAATTAADVIPNLI
jgi:hypothetical protein